MHGRIVLLFFLASGSLMSMNQEVPKGIWDESGNYLGPGRLVMEPEGYAAVFYPLSQAAYGFAFHPDGVPAASSSGQWVVGVEQLDDPAVSGPAALDEVPVEADFAPVASASTQESTRFWADFDDNDDEPPSLPAGWVRLSNSAPNVPMPSPVPPQKKQLRSDAVSPKDKRKKVSGHQVSNQIDDDNDDTMVRAGVDSVSDWRKRTPLNERLAVAAGGTDNKQQIMALFWRKVTWLTKHCSKPLCPRNCEEFSQLLDAQFSNFSAGPKEAHDLLQLAHYCMRSAKQQRYENGKKGFARVARRLICIAEPSLTEGQKRFADMMDIQAKIMLAPQTKS